MDDDGLTSHDDASVFVKSASSSSCSSLSSSHNNNASAAISSGISVSTSNDDSSACSSLRMALSQGMIDGDDKDDEGGTSSMPLRPSQTTKPQQGIESSSGTRSHRYSSNNDGTIPEHQVLRNYRSENQTNNRRLVEYFLVVSAKEVMDESTAASTSRQAGRSSENQQRFPAFLPSFGEAHRKNNPTPDDNDDDNAHSIQNGKSPLFKLIQRKFHPTITSRYPLQDHEDNPLNPMVTHFCHPTLRTTTDIRASSLHTVNTNTHVPIEHHQQQDYPAQEIIEPKINYIMPKLHYFVLTNHLGRKMYGTCLTIYEPYELSVCDESNLADQQSQMQQSRSTAPSSPNNYMYTSPRQRAVEPDTMVTFDEETINSPFFLPRIEVAMTKPTHQTHREKSKSNMLDENFLNTNNRSCADSCICQDPQLMEHPRYFYLPRCLVILSTWPYLRAFREYLTQLYKIYFSNSTEVPLERYIVNLCCEIAAPPPGTFEVQCLLMKKKIKFWAPPANQPIAWVALPFEHLFECLSIQNIITVWHALVLEKQILLVSSQISLLTECSEILISLLFPMVWQHLYIPVVPQFLLQLLDAPIPYLCGVSHENLLISYSHDLLSRECIVVNLDSNKITFGKQTPYYPPIPERRRNKLIRGILKANAGYVFHGARLLLSNTTTELETSKQKSSVAHKAWKERLEKFDAAYNLPFTPDSPNLWNYESDFAMNDNDDHSRQQQHSWAVAWDAVQESFFKFFVSLLQSYRNFLIMPNTSSEQGFQANSFIKTCKAEDQPFLQELCATQQFDAFLTRRLYDPGEADVTFFDQSIDAKKNRSKLNLKKIGTPFLQVAQTNKQLRVIVAIQPNNSPPNGFRETEENLPYQFQPIDRRNRGMHSSPRWPETFNEALFTKPRPIPSIIHDEFDRQWKISERLRRKFVQLRFPVFGDCNPNPEVGTFTLFFVTFLSFVGRPLEDILDLPDDPTAINIPLTNNSTSVNSSDKGLPRRNLASLEEEKDVALAELDLAFEVMIVLRQRGYAADLEAHKCLIEACGRCGNPARATQAIAMVNDDGYKTDSAMYSRLIDAFSLKVSSSNMVDKFSEINSRIATKTEKEATKKHTIHLLTEPNFFSSSIILPNRSETSSHESYSSYGHRNEDHGLMNDLYNAVSNAASRRRNKKVNPKSFIVTEPVFKQVVLGENTLEVLYPDLCIDTQSETCPQCQSNVTEQDIIKGWKACDSQDYTTTCPHCTRRFVARFRVSCSDPSFYGSEGYFSPLICEYFSPWVLLKEFRNILKATNGLREMLNPGWRRGHDINARLWWNLIVAFTHYRLPITFLLQGSFRNRLIFPTPDASFTG